jgi:hypothetical protein
MLRYQISRAKTIAFAMLIWGYSCLITGDKKHPKAAGHKELQTTAETIIGSAENRKYITTKTELR